MTLIHIVPGNSGRLLVNERLIAYFQEPSLKVRDVLEAAPRDPFKQLAKVIVAQDFDIAPMLAVDRVTNRLFLFGELSITVNGSEMSGSDATFWVEHALGEDWQLACNPEHAPTAGDTRLEAGYVPAGGFVCAPAPIESSATSGAPEVPAEPDQAPLPRENETETAETSDRTTAGVPGDGGQATDDNGVASELHEHDGAGGASILDERHVDLERLGSHEDQAPSSPAPETNGDPETDHDTKPDQDPETEPDTVGARREPPRQIERRSHEGIARPSSRRTFREPPGAPSMRPDGTTQPDPRTTTDEPIAANTALLTLSDGQTFAVTSGLLVGRHPTKNGVPAGYVTATVAGGSASRVHLEVTVSGRTVRGRDCETPNGSRLRRDGGSSSLPTDSAGMPLHVGDVIEFGEGLTLEFAGWSNGG